MCDASNAAAAAAAVQRAGGESTACLLSPDLTRGCRGDVDIKQIPSSGLSEAGQCGGCYVVRDMTDAAAAAEN